MSTRDYLRLDIETFGRLLLESGDLDPVYVALRGMDWGREQRDRWLTAYWLCYHCGAACWLSEQSGQDFWQWLRRAAYNGERWLTPIDTRWPRSPERRHWRGKAAVASVEFLERRYGTPGQMAASSMVEYVSRDWESGKLAPGPLSYRLDVKPRVTEHYGFGDWIAFKVADMLERCCGIPVAFDHAEVMYSSPREAALRLFKARAGLPGGSKVKDERAAIDQVTDHLMRHLGGLDAPGGGRRVDLQEIETALCKWGSHMNGHYEPGHDLREIRVGTEPWSRVCSTARIFLDHLPVIGQGSALALMATAA